MIAVNLWLGINLFDSGNRWKSLKILMLQMNDCHKPLIGDKLFGWAFSSERGSSDYFSNLPHSPIEVNHDTRFLHTRTGPHRFSAEDGSVTTIMASWWWKQGIIWKAWKSCRKRESRVTIVKVLWTAWKSYTWHPKGPRRAYPIKTYRKRTGNCGPRAWEPCGKHGSLAECVKVVENVKVVCNVNVLQKAPQGHHVGAESTRKAPDAREPYENLLETHR